MYKLWIIMKHLAKRYLQKVQKLLISSSLLFFLKVKIQFESCFSFVCASESRQVRSLCCASFEATLKCKDFGRRLPREICAGVCTWECSYRLCDGRLLLRGDQWQLSRAFFCTDEWTRRHCPMNSAFIKMLICDTMNKANDGKRRKQLLNQI